MRHRQRGFTLVELMITVAILGILASVAIPAFMEYMKKSKTAEAELALDQMVKKVRTYRLEKNTLPPSSNVLPSSGACGTATGKTAVVAPSTWAADPGFGPMGFHMDEGGYYQYIWLEGGNIGFAIAIGDLDCDLTSALMYRQVNVAGDGNINTIKFDFSAGD